MRKLVICAGMAGLILATQTVRAEDANALLSKTDAAQMFEMTEAQWISNAMAIKQAGLGIYAVAPTGEYTLYMRPDPVAGLLIVSPSYRGSNKSNPWKLTVTTVMDTPLTRLTFEAMSTDDVEAMLLAAMREMKPEFSVMGYLVRANDNPPAVYFTIFEHGAFPLIDALNKEGTVCPTIGGNKACIRDSMIGSM